MRTPSILAAGGLMALVGAVPALGADLERGRRADVRATEVIAAPIPVFVVPACSEARSAALIRCEPRSEAPDRDEPSLLRIQQTISLTSPKPYPDVYQFPGPK